jgi:DNA-binding MarR family transcriptional regulator
MSIISRIFGRKPTAREEFLNGKYMTRHEDLNTHPVTVILEENRNRPMTVKDIKEATGIKDSTVRGALKRLRKAGRLIHKEPHFIIK